MKIKILLVIIILLISFVEPKKVVPYNYPVFKQCDPRWASNVMGKNGDTICQVGCLMSSTSMAINGHSIKIDGKNSDPETLNAWLRANDGYDDGSDLKENVIPQIAPSKISWVGRADSLTREQVIEKLKSHKDIVIANVMNGRHFVLVVGYDDSDDSFYYVNDPGFTRSTYKASDIVGWRLFTME
ncbi:hypothetical protein M0812_02677 [Anaeramoeba flamelloides]|uniref:Peptidase C39-like domain-containing protein n=1 Tax=Anaeramoeba flamelloides TaxID=1746091 RepID=A0AAV7YQC2_9EUKA|nr:hypothetical protein M0812_02677 [Anaeramoeba flamelloides]